jgi:WD40 repeat protein
VTGLKSILVFFLCGPVLLIGLLVPAVHAVDPLWTEKAAPGNELSGVVVSADGSTIVAGGDQLITLSRDGKKRWTGWSSTHLDISRDGSYIVTSQGQTVRLFSGSGTLLWERPIEVTVRDLSMTPDASLIAASGGGRVQTIFNSGTPLGMNVTSAVNHIKISPVKDQVIVTTTADVQRFNLSIVPLWSDNNATQDLVDISADGSSFVTVTYNRVRLYHGSGTLLWDRTVHGGNALALAYSRDGSTIVLGRDDNTVQVLDRNSTLLWTAEAQGWVTSVAVSDDGSTVIAGSMDRNLYVFDRAGNRLGTFTATGIFKTQSVAVSGDGSVVVAVDDSAVYGFSRSQFAVPATTMVTTPLPVVSTTVALPAVPETSSALLPVVSATTEAPLPWTVPLMALGLLLLFRVRRP